ncbi:MAG TPA: SCO family protein [Chthoniobacterales bacterium]
MNAATAAQSPTKRGVTFGSIVWYATLLLLPLLTIGFILFLRQARVEQLARRTAAQYGTVPGFQLTNQNGQPFGSEQLAGKIWIADFVFTSCRGPCPIISSRMSEMQSPLKQSDVHLVSFTIDPETDTPDVLREYADRLHAQPGRWDFLTGPKEAIYDLTMNGFKLAVAEGGEDGPVHSTRAALVDRRGTIRGYFDITAPDGVAKILAAANQLLKEQPASGGQAAR